ncbi:MAG: methylenetetrahydrofolate reductase [Bacteroidota bacterium]|nr:methylenetetrahydrofolate reductase [Bacteroidota bacterium]
MFLNKIQQRKSGVLLYGITPPKSQTPPEKVVEIAQRTLERLHNLDIDALVVYDVQDESARTTEERPFPFVTALDPFEFSVNHLHTLKISKIIYRPAGKFTKDELAAWLDGLHKHNFYPVFVGVPAPDFKVKTSLTEAYQIWSKNKGTSVIGAVTIPERHAVLKDEDIRIMDKMNSGVSFFVSQCVFDVDFAKKVIEDLSASCIMHGKELPTIIFTITACGSIKTLEFMEWLGIHIPDPLKSELKASENILAKSLEVCIEIAAELIKYCSSKSVPFGFNVESVAIRKEEIEASIFLTNKIGSMLKEAGIRK